METTGSYDHVGFIFFERFAVGTAGSGSWLVAVEERGIGMLLLICNGRVFLHKRSNGHINVVAVAGLILSF